MVDDSAKKQDGFSFDGDPGELQQDNELDFTFSDIPVLGENQDKFSFDQPPPAKGEDAAIASFEEILRDPEVQGENLEDEDSKEADEEGSKDFSQGVDEGFIEEQRKKWQAKVQKKKQRKRRLITMRVFFVAVPLFVISGVIYLGTSLWFKYQAEQDARKNYHVNRERSIMDRKKAEEAKRLKAEMEATLTEGDFAFTEEKYQAALDIFLTLEEKSFFKKGYISPRIGQCYENLTQPEKAIEKYQEAISAGTREPTAYTQLAELLIKSGNPDEALVKLEAGIAAFPENPKLATILAEIYYHLKNNDKSLENFQRLKRTDMTRPQLDIFVKLLMDKKEYDEAVKVYFYIAKTDLDFEAYLKAVNLAETPEEKIDIIANATGVLREPYAKNGAYFILFENLKAANKENDASTQIRKIDPIYLYPRYIMPFIKYSFEYFGKDRAIKIISKLIRANRKNFQLQEDIQAFLNKSEMPDTVIKLYSQWWSAEPDDPWANYLYGKLLGKDPAAKGYFLKSVQVNPGFFEAYLELGRIYTVEKDWVKAEKVYHRCSEIRPKGNHAQYLLALIRLYAGKGKEALTQYENYLKEQDYSEIEQAKALIDLAMYLPDSATALKYLAVMNENEKLADESKTQEIKIKLLYGELKEADFNGIYPKAAREYHILFLLSKGQTRKVLLMRTPPDEFPEFWKVFLARRIGVDGWEKNADLLIKKSKNEIDSSKQLIVNLWLDKVSPDEARKKTHLISPANEALFFFMLAEEYRRKKKVTKAKVCYVKAMSIKPNFLYQVIDYYSRKKK